jgi:hypothetical protein
MNMRLLPIEEGSSSGPDEVTKRVKLHLVKEEKGSSQPIQRTKEQEAVIKLGQRIINYGMAPGEICPSDKEIFDLMAKTRIDLIALRMQKHKLRKKRGNQSKNGLEDEII